jgi:predicted acylesterase/phospholipase RssA
MSGGPIKFMKRSFKFGNLIAIVTLVCSNSIGQHADTSSILKSHKLPLAFTSSGAVSLGSYQAGYHYYFVEWLKLNKHLFDVKTITGASAGAINALLTVFSLADTICSIDTQSVFYRGWIPIGINQLKGSKNALGIINREGMDKLADPIIGTALQKIQSGKTLAKLDLVLAITGTRLSPQIDHLNSLRIPRVKEKFVIKVDKYPGTPLYFRNFLYDTLNLSWCILPFGEASDKDSLKDILKGIIYSSSAFPGAFAPYDKLPVRTINTFVIKKSGTCNFNLDTVTLWKDLSKNVGCFSNDSGVSFVDGGIFDNEPIRLAYTLSLHGLTLSDSGYRWRNHLTKKADTAENSLIYAYLNPGNVMYPHLGKQNSIRQNNLITMAFNVLPKMAEASMRSELITLLEENDKFSDRLLLTQNYAATMSGYMGNFFGFFDKNFRIFDFYLGLYDAEHFLRKMSEARGGFIRNFTNDTIYFPALAYDYSDAPDIIKARWKHFTMPVCDSADFPDNADALARKQNQAYANTTGTSLHMRIKDTLHIRYEYLFMKTVLNSIYNQIDSLSDSTIRFKVPIPDTSLVYKCNPNFIIMFQTSLDRLWARWQCLADGKDVSPGYYPPDFEKKWKNVLKLSVQPPQFVLNHRVNNRYKKYVEMIASGKEEDALMDMLYDYRYRYSFNGGDDGVKSRDKMTDKILHDFNYFASNAFHNAHQSILGDFLKSRVLNFYKYKPKQVKFSLNYQASKGQGGWGFLVHYCNLRMPIGDNTHLYFNLEAGPGLFGPREKKPNSFLLFGDEVPKEVYATAGFNMAVLSDNTSKITPVLRYLYSNAVFQPTISFCGMYGRYSDQLNPEKDFNCWGFKITPQLSIFELIKFGISYEWQFNALFKNPNPFRYQAGFYWPL